MRKVLIGERFGLLLVVREVSRERRGRMLHCACDCGNSRIIPASRLRIGAKSCGCLRKTHGEAHSTPEYISWQGMIQRCHNPNSSSYSLYGERGISVCDEWRSSFKSFLDHVGRKPSRQHSLDRIDNSHGYEPGNVRWATPSQQQRNKRNNRILTVGGSSRTIAEWSERSGIKFCTIFRRLKLGWSEARAVLQPLR